MPHRFGPLSSEPCRVCGDYFNNREEPRFLYVVCEEHQHVAPIYIPPPPDPEIVKLIGPMIRDLGRDITVRLADGSGRAYRVPRLYIAIHGLRGTELPMMGFPRVDTE